MSSTSSPSSTHVGLPACGEHEHVDTDAGSLPPCRSTRAWCLVSRFSRSRWIPQGRTDPRARKHAAGSGVEWGTTLVCPSVPTRGGRATDRGCDRTPHARMRSHDMGRPVHGGRGILRRARTAGSGARRPGLGWTVGRRRPPGIVLSYELLDVEVFDIHGFRCSSPCERCTTRSVAWTTGARASWRWTWPQPPASPASLGWPPTTRRTPRGAVRAVSLPSSVTARTCVRCRPWSRGSTDSSRSRRQRGTCAVLG